MKKRCAAVAAAVLMSMNLLGCTTSSQDPWMPLDGETAQEIFRLYPEELRWIEETYQVEIQDYTAETNALLTRAAIEQYETDRFTRLSQLVTDLAAAAWNGEEGGDAWTAAKPFGPLKGVWFWEVPVGCSMAGDLTGTVEIARGELVQDLEISDPVSVEIPLDQADGPADRTTLPDGATVATHRIFTGVLWGVILEGPGEAEYRIACPRGVGYAHLAQIASPAYVERAVDHTVVTCEHMLDLQQALETDPGRFLAAPVTSEEVEPTDAGSME